MDELREKLKEILRLAQHQDVGEGDISFEDFWSDQILALIKEAGYVRLFPDQSLPPIPRQDIAHIIMERDTILREAGWRKVEL